MFPAVPLPIIRSLFTVHSALVYVTPVLQTCMTYTSAECTVNKLPETCRVSCRSKFGKLVHLVRFVIKKHDQVLTGKKILCNFTIKSSRSFIQETWYCIDERIFLHHVTIFWSITRELWLIISVSYTVLTLFDSCSLLLPSLRPACGRSDK